MSNGVAPEPCPDEATIAAFTQGELPADQAGALEAHLDACEACGLVVAELARIFASDRPAEPEPEAGAGEARRPSEELAATLGAGDSEAGPRPLGALLAAGAAVGRYRVLDCVGVGGMGVVYAAYDPVLDRRVALKLLRGSKEAPGSQGRSARLLREAQTLAKLTHPNVITVHDVGTWESAVFMAMEYVEGLTLKGWLRTKRTWPELREVFVAAGRGLAAAHAADLVHRDFKPDNVLIGHDGRVRVTDFGLARWGQASRAPVQSSQELRATDELRISSLGANVVSMDEGAAVVGSDLAVSLTETGSLVGTPAYMAPEQYEQRPADASSDQFAFCVALYEAIYGERPFAGRTVAELASNVLEGRLAETPHEVVVPRVVRQALRRGLSRRPSARFESMDELLATLDHRPARRLWSWVGVGVPLAGLGAVGLWAYAQAEIMRSPYCRTERGLAEVWGAERREAIGAAFLATGVPYAAETVERVLPAVDEYVAGWERLRARSCDPVEGEVPGSTSRESPGVAALRERCLDRRRVALETLLEGFDEATAATVPRAVGSVLALPDIERCGDPEALMAELPPPTPPELRVAVEAVRDDLARGDGLLAGGRYAEGLELARRIDDAAQALDHRPLQAEARHFLGRMLDFTGDAVAATAAFEEAGLLATASRHRRVLARALIDEVYVLGVSQPYMAEADKVALRARAELEGLGMLADGESALLLNQGSVAYRRGDYSAASELFRRSLALRDREREPLRWADAAFNLATIEMLMGRERKAIVQLQTYIEVFEGAVGRMHPEVSAGYQNLGVAYSNVGLNGKARAALERAAEIRLKTLGADHPLYAASLNSLGAVAEAEGELEEGLRYSQRSVAILTAHAADPVETATNRVDVSRMLMGLGRLDEAEAEIGAALEVLQEGMGPDHAHVAPAYDVLAHLAAARSDAAGVRRHMDRLDAIRSATLGEGHPELEDLVVERATLLAAAGEHEEAIAGLRALLDRGGPETATVARCTARFTLAQLSWADPGGRAEARALAEAAESCLRKRGLGSQARAARAWLDEHPDGAPADGAG